MDVEVADGVRLHVRRQGSPGGPAYLLVHGLASNARLWDGVAARLAEQGADVVAMDLRGHGESDSPPDGYDTQTAAADVAALAQQLGLERPVVAGQSWGGNVVLELAAARPDLPKAIALVDGGWLHLGDRFADFDQCWAQLAPPVMRIPYADLAERIRQGHPDWPPEGVAGTLANLEAAPDGTARNRLSREHHREILHSLWAHRPRDLYPEIDVPVLLLPAGRSAGGPLVAEALAALPDGRVSAYPGADHDVHAQHPDRVAADLWGLV